MTRIQHQEEYDKLWYEAMAKLQESIDANSPSKRFESYEEYKIIMKQANKHRRIALAMWTRMTNKALGYKAF